MSEQGEKWQKLIRDAVVGASLRLAVRDLIFELEPLHLRFELVDVESDGVDVWLEPTRGLSICGLEGSPDVVIAGGLGGWLELLSGDVPYVRQVNIAHGRLTAKGSAVHLSWLTPVLSEIFSAAQPAVAGEISTGVSAVGVIAGQYIEVAGSQAYVDTTGAGPNVILIHTAGRDARQWHPVMARLAADFTLFAPDLPGRGRSEPMMNGPGYLNEVSELAEWLRSVADSLGLESYLVAGCSLGGNLALMLGASDPRVLGVLALQGADHTPTISQGSLEMMDHPRVSLPHANMDFSMSLVGTDADARANEAIRRGVRTINAPAQRADLTAYTRCDIRSLMPNVSCPVILFRGEDDWVVSEDMVRSTAERLTNATVQIDSRSGIGHFPHVEKPDLVADLLVELRSLI